MEKIIVKMEVRYDGLNFRKNGLVDLNFKSPYDNIVDTLSLVRLINTNMTVKAKVNKEIVILGNFYIKGINIDRDGESSIKLGSEVDSVEMKNLNELSGIQIPIEIACVGMVDTGDDD